MLLYYQLCLYLSIALTGLLLLQWNSHITVNFSIVYLLIPFLNLGYFRIAVSENVEEALLANGLVYICSCFLQLGYITYIFSFSKIKFPLPLGVPLFLVSGFIGIMALTTQRNHMIYRSSDIVKIDGVTHIVKEYGPLHSVYYVLLVLYFIIEAVVIFLGLRKSNVSKRNSLLLLSLFGVNLAAFLLGRLFGTSVELLPAGYILSQAILLVMSGRLKYYAISDYAVNTIIREGKTGFVSFDRSRKLLGWNGPAKTYLPELLDLYIDQTMPRGDDRFRELNKWLDSADIQKTASTFAFSRDNTSFSVTVTFLDPKKKHSGYLIRIEDNTDEQRYIELLEQARASAEAVSKAKGDFLANMSHEIRTPINAILGMDEIILRESSEESTLAYAEDIRKAGNTLLGLINDVLDFSKIEAGKTDIIPVDYQLSSLLNDLVNMIEPRAEEKGLEFRFRVDPMIPEYLHGDEIRIKQIIMNILTNAVKYTVEGSVTMTVGQTRGDGYTDLTVSVRDTGIGIKQDDIDKLFIAFERVEENRNRTIEGTGLGMTITQELLRLMGSKLQVTSEYGKGSEFFFTLRQDIVKDTPIGDYDQALENSASARKKYHESFHAPQAKVLVVDDTEMNLVVFKGLLKKTKIQIDSALSGDEAIQLARRKKYDLIFLDHRMPHKDGIETLHEMNADPDCLNHETPFVCLTANAVSGVREMYIDAGFSEYLTKPIDPPRLEALLIEMLPDELIREGEDAEEAADSVEKNELLEIYLGDIDRMSDMIEELYTNEDWTNYTIKVHALKSTSRIVGQTEIADLAERLEHAGDSGDLGLIREKTGELIARYRAVKAEYPDYMTHGAAGADEEKPEATEELMGEAYEAIEIAAESFDYDGLCGILDELSAYKIPNAHEKLMKELTTAADNVDWGTIKKLLAGR